MQVTLVAQYGPKPPGLAAFLRHLQNNLSASLGRAFEPYDIEQVHATLVGLEGCRVDGVIRGKRSGLSIDLSGIVGFLRGDAFTAIQVRVGGYRAADRHSFRSRDEHPYLRSFSIQGGTAVAIGWPADGAQSPDSLDRLRRSLERFGVRDATFLHGSTLGVLGCTKVPTGSASPSPWSSPAQQRSGRPSAERVDVRRPSRELCGCFDEEVPPPSVVARR